MIQLIFQREGVVTRRHVIQVQREHRPRGIPAHNAVRRRRQGRARHRDRDRVALRGLAKGLGRNRPQRVARGLIRANDVTFVTGVPILKDIPLIGSFFRNTTTVKEKRELLIFVTPRIITSFSAENGR